MAHLHGQSTLSSSSSQGGGSGSNLFSQYTKPQNQSNTLNSVGNSKGTAGNNAGEEISGQIASSPNNSNKASVSKNGNAAETPTLQLEATTPLDSQFAKDYQEIQDRSGRMIQEEEQEEQEQAAAEAEAEIEAEEEIINPNPVPVHKQHSHSHNHSHQNHNQADSNSLMEEEKVSPVNQKEDVMESEEVEDSDSDHNNVATVKVQKVEPLKKKVRICLNICCLTDGTDATLWCRQKVRNSNICKQCFEAFKKEQYCYFCFQIYDDNSSYSDGKDWIECDSCNHWHHLDCEANHGIKNIQEVKDDSNFKYTCPRCRLPAEPKSSGQKPKAHSHSHSHNHHHHNHHNHHHHKSKLEILEQSTKKQHIQEFSFESQTIVDLRAAVIAAPVHDSPIDEHDPEDIITKKLKLNPEIQEENLVTIPVPRETFPVVFTQKDFIKKKLDSTINRAFLNKKKIPVKVPLALSEFATEIERLMNHYGGRKLQLSENEIKADLNLFRELSGSTCTTDEKSSRSGEQIMEKVIDMWDEQSRSDYNEEERYPRRNNMNKAQSQSKILRSNKKIVVPVEPIFQDYSFEVREKTRGGRGRKRGKGRGGRHPSKKI